MEFFHFSELNVPRWIFQIYWLTYVLASFWGIRIIIHRKSQNRELLTFLFFCFFVLFSIFYCIDTDYFRYRDWVFVNDLTFFEKEPVYVLLVAFVNSFNFVYPYEVLRLIIWGGALLLVVFTTKNYGNNISLLTLIYLFISFNGLFCYARASLAMAFFFLGFSICSIRQSIIRRFIGILIMFSSLAFHNELIIAIALVPIAFFPLESRKNTILTISVVFVLSIILNLVINNLGLLDFSTGGDTYSNKVEHFQEIDDGFSVTVGIKDYFMYSLFFIPFLIISRFIRNNTVPLAYIRLYRLTFGIVISVILLMTLFGFKHVLVYRPLFISMIPISILLAYMNSQRKLSKQFNFLLYVLAFIYITSHYMYKI